MQSPNAADTLGSSVRIAVTQLQQQGTSYDHVILAATPANTGKSARFHLVETGQGGLDALRTKLRGRQTQFALLRVQARILLVISLAHELTGLKRAQTIVQGRALQAALGAVLFASLTIATATQLTSALVGSKLQLDGFVHVDSPDLHQDFRASWASALVSSSIANRPKPSAPCSPEQADHDANWSRPVSDLGSFYRSSARLPSSTSSLANLVVSRSFRSISDEQHPSREGMVIDLESVAEVASQESSLALARSASGPTAEGNLPPLPPGNKHSEYQQTRRNSSAVSSASASVEPAQLPKPSRSVCPQNPRQSGKLNADERKRLSDERQRLRADEVIREEVMRKLRADQQGSLKSPSTRTPRSPLTPPLAPPPPFAPPLAPLSPSAYSLSSRNTASIPSPRSTSKKTIDNVLVSARAMFTDRLSIVTVPPSPISSNPANTTRDGPASNDWPSDMPRISESHESLRTSMQTLNLWEFADTLTRDDSFSSVASLAPPTASMSFKPERSDSGIAIPHQPRSRQVSGSESAVSASPDRHGVASSSSRGSVGACSIFDKDLPVPPIESESGNGTDGGDEWIDTLEPPDSTTQASAPWMKAPESPYGRRRGGSASSMDAEMQELRDRLVQAEARARAAEDAAETAVREAQSETRRLAEELANVERGSKDKLEAEAIRRAKWAREQAARNQLDAYERSKLEADEMRRRRAMDEQRQRESDRANRIRQEREWREQEAERVKLEYEQKIQILAEREAKLKAEAEAKEQLQRERMEQARARAGHRQKRLAELTAALRAARGSDAETETAPLVFGWLNLQVEGAVQWRRRWYRVVDRELLLSRSAADLSTTTTIALEPTRLVSISDALEDCLMRHALCLEVGPKAQEEAVSPSETHTYIISTDTREAKEEIELVVEAIATL